MNNKVFFKKINNKNNFSHVPIAADTLIELRTFALYKRLSFVGPHSLSPTKID